jgi:hypothetical protein
VMPVAAARLDSREALRSSWRTITGLAIGRSVFIGRTAMREGLKEPGFASVSAEPGPSRLPWLYEPRSQALFHMMQYSCTSGKVSDAITWPAPSNGTGCYERADLCHGAPD